MSSLGTPLALPMDPNMLPVDRIRPRAPAAGAGSGPQRRCVEDPDPVTCCLPPAARPRIGPHTRCRSAQLPPPSVRVRDQAAGGRARGPGGTPGVAGRNADPTPPAGRLPPVPRIRRPMPVTHSRQHRFPGPPLERFGLRGSRCVSGERRRVLCHTGWRRLSGRTRRTRSARGTGARVRAPRPRRGSRSGPRPGALEVKAAAAVEHLAGFEPGQTRGSSASMISPRTEALPSDLDPVFGGIRGQLQHLSRTTRRTSGKTVAADAQPTSTRPPSERSTRP